MTYLLLAMSAIWFLAAIHPFVTYPMTLYLMRRRHNRPIAFSASGLQETFSICVCAYNEEATIRRKAENLLALQQVLPGLEIMIYVDGATDRTANILQEYADRIKVYAAPSRHGKTHGMNFLVSQTKASIVIFSDANVMLETASVQALRRYFTDPQVGCVCGHLKYVNAGESVTAASGSLYWRLEEWIKQLESDTGSVMGADGSVFAIRRRLHHPPPDDVIDDMYVSLSILNDGYRIVRAPDVVGYEEAISSSHEEFKRKVRIACQAFNVHRMLWPRLRQLNNIDIYKYVSHKLLRWLVIYWLGLAILFFEAGMFTAGLPIFGALLALLGLGVLWAGVHFRISPVLQVADILGAFAGAGLGVWRSLMGDRFQTWSLAASIRKKEQGIA